MKRLLDAAGIDAPVVYGVLSKVALAGFNLLIIILIAWRLPSVTQGYYYTYLNLAALQVFAELGLGIVIVQVGSHLWASLGLDEAGRIQGDSDARSRLISLGRKAFRWYGIAGIAAAVGVGVGGSVFFSSSPSQGVDWKGSWLLLCAAVGLKMWQIPAWSLLEGSNQVASLYRVRLLNAVGGGLFTSGSLLLGGGLWSPGIGVAAEALLGGAYLAACHGAFLGSFASPSTGPTIDWKREIQPLQVRIAGSWISGYFITSLLTPVLFYFQGPGPAGQWGMTWSMFGMVASVSLLWISTKGPQFGVLIARREFESLDREFFRSARRSVLVAVFGAALVWLGLFLLSELRHPLAARVLSPLPAACLAASVALTSLPAAMSIYLRAHAKEPLMVASLVQALLLFLSALTFAPLFGIVGTAISYFCVVGLIGMPWSILIWRRCRKEWHAAGGPV